MGTALSKFPEFPVQLPVQRQISNEQENEFMKYIDGSMTKCTK